MITTGKDLRSVNAGYKKTTSKRTVITPTQVGSGHDKLANDMVPVNLGLGFGLANANTDSVVCTGG